MAVIVNSGSTVTVIASQGLTLTADETVEAGGILQGAGTFSGGFDLLNLGEIAGLTGGLIIDTGTFDNQGVLVATNGGNLTVGASVNVPEASNGTLTAGTWEAVGGVISISGSEITVDDATIDLSNAGMLNAGSTSVLNSLSSIGGTGVLSLDAMASIGLAGPLADNGTVSVNDTTLSVPGITVYGGAQLNIFGGAALTLTAGSTIVAGGQINAAGTITGGSDLVNQGEVSAENPGGLTIDTNSFSNQGIVDSAVAPITVQASVTFTNLSNGTLTGGTWNDSDTISLPGGTIGSDDAVINFISTAAEFLEADPATSGTQSIANTVTEIGSTGVLNVFSTDWAVPGSLNVDGQFDFDSSAGIAGTLSVAGGLTISPTGTLFASGTIASPLTLNGVLDIFGDIILTNTMTGTGTISGAANDGALVLAIPGMFAIPVVRPTFLDVNIPNTGGTVTLASTITGSPFFEIQNAASLSSMNALELPNATSNDISFVGVGGQLTGPNFGELILDDPSGFSGGILFFNNDSTIVLHGVLGNTATWNDNTLTITNGLGTVDTLSLTPRQGSLRGGLGQDYSQASFVATPDSTNDTTTITASGIVDNPTLCFREGTRITTPMGGVEVERLSACDRVLCHFGEQRRILWIGHRVIDCRRRPVPSRVWPIRISPHAFAPGQPCRDLFLSPDHAVFVNRVLIPIRYLINETTIRQVTTDRVTYYHIELDEHDVVLAEGLATESYLENGDRGFFGDRDNPIQLFPGRGVRTWEMAGCAPLVVAGPGLVRARAMLEKRASSGMVRGHATQATANAA